MADPLSVAMQAQWENTKGSLKALVKFSSLGDKKKYNKLNTSVQKFIMEIEKKELQK